MCPANAARLRTLNAVVEPVHDTCALGVAHGRVHEHRLWQPPTIATFLARATFAKHSE